MRSFFALDEPRFPLRVRYALFIALTLVGVGIAYVIDVGHIIALTPSVALGLIAEYGREELVLRAGRPSPDASGRPSIVTGVHPACGRMLRLRMTAV